MKTVISNSLTGVIFFFLWLLAMTLSGGRAQAQESGFGLGIILGEPTGLTAKKWLSTDTALDFAAAWSFGGEDSITLHADFLQHKFNLIKIESGSLPVYYGIGEVKWVVGPYAAVDFRGTGYFSVHEDIIDQRYLIPIPVATMSLL